MTKFLIIVSTLGLAIAWGCGSSSSPTKTDAKVFNDAPGSGSGSGAMLTVKNAPTGTPWCNITIAGGTASSAGVQTHPITSSGPLTLTATPISSSFKIDTNMWHHTDGDTGTGDSGTVSGMTSTATVTVTAGANKCVWVCCPFTNGTGCSTLAEQCP